MAKQSSRLESCFMRISTIVCVVMVLASANCKTVETAIDLNKITQGYYMMEVKGKDFFNSKGNWIEAVYKLPKGTDKMHFVNINTTSLEFMICAEFRSKPFSSIDDCKHNYDRGFAFFTPEEINKQKTRKLRIMIRPYFESEELKNLFYGRGIPFTPAPLIVLGWGGLSDSETWHLIGDIGLASNKWRKYSVEVSLDSPDKTIMFDTIDDDFNTREVNARIKVDNEYKEIKFYGFGTLSLNGKEFKKACKTTKDPETKKLPATGFCFIYFSMRSEETSAMTLRVFDSEYPMYIDYSSRDSHRIPSPLGKDLLVVFYLRDLDSKQYDFDILSSYSKLSVKAKSFSINNMKVYKGEVDKYLTMKSASGSSDIHFTFTRADVDSSGTGILLRIKNEDNIEFGKDEFYASHGSLYLSISGNVGSLPISQKIKGWSNKGTFRYYNVKIASNSDLMISLHMISKGNADIYVNQGKSNLPTKLSYYKKSDDNFDDELSLTSSDHSKQGVKDGEDVYYTIGIFAPQDTVAYTLEAYPNFARVVKAVIGTISSITATPKNPALFEFSNSDIWRDDSIHIAVWSESASIQIMQFTIDRSTFSADDDVKDMIEKASMSPDWEVDYWNQQSAYRRNIEIRKSCPHCTTMIAATPLDGFESADISMVMLRKDNDLIYLKAGDVLEDTLEIDEEQSFVTENLHRAESMTLTLTVRSGAVILKIIEDGKTKEYPVKVPFYSIDSTQKFTIKANKLFDAFTYSIKSSSFSSIQIKASNYELFERLIPGEIVSRDFSTGEVLYFKLKKNVEYKSVQIKLTQFRYSRSKLTPTIYKVDVLEDSDDMKKADYTLRNHEDTRMVGQTTLTLKTPTPGYYVLKFTVDRPYGPLPNDRSPSKKTVTQSTVDHNRIQLIINNAVSLRGNMVESFNLEVGKTLKIDFPVPVATTQQIDISTCSDDVLVKASLDKPVDKNPDFSKKLNDFDGQFSNSFEITKPSSIFYKIYNGGLKPAIITIKSKTSTENGIVEKDKLANKLDLGNLEPQGYYPYSIKGSNKKYLQVALIRHGIVFDKDIDKVIPDAISADITIRYLLYKGEIPDKYVERCSLTTFEMSEYEELRQKYSEHIEHFYIYRNTTKDKFDWVYESSWTLDNYKQVRISWEKGAEDFIASLEKGDRFFVLVQGYLTYREESKRTSVVMGEEQVLEKRIELKGLKGQVLESYQMENSPEYMAKKEAGKSSTFFSFFKYAILLIVLGAIAVYLKKLIDEKGGLAAASTVFGGSGGRRAAREYVEVDMSALT